MELELGLAPPNAHHPTMISNHQLADELSSSSSDSSAARGGKRGFREAFQQETLPLFDDGSCSSVRSGKKPLVGWPPVSSARSRACGGGACNYVKVKKEGDAIGRKVDLSLHASYDELLATLRRMFPTTTSQDDKEISGSSSHVVITYEDGEGDWMLVGDVPWDDFARSVKRLKILR
ncbi:unnamed protein product [Urochloa humidicola]